MAHSYGLSYYELMDWTAREMYLACECISRRQHNDIATHWNIYGKMKGAKRNVIPYQLKEKVETPEKKEENEKAALAIERHFKARTQSGKNND